MKENVRKSRNVELKCDWRLIAYVRASVKTGCHQSFCPAQTLILSRGVYAVGPLSKRMTGAVPGLNLASIRADITTSFLFEASAKM